MGLGTYLAPSHTVDLQGGSFKVKGLSLQDVSLLINQHLPDIEALFDLFTSADTASDVDFRPLAVSIVSQAPGFAANVIALAAGEPDNAKVAETLPFPVQVDVLLKIGDLTFSEVGGAKKALERLLPLITSTKAMAAKAMAAKAMAAKAMAAKAD